MQRRRRDQKLKRNDSQTFKYNSFKQLFLQCICFSEVATKVVLKKLFLIISQYSKQNTCVLRWSFFLIKLQTFHRMKTSIKPSCTNNIHTGGINFCSCYIWRIASCFFRHTGIPGLWMQKLDSGLWTLYVRLRTLDSGCWTLDAGL